MRTALTLALLAPLALPASAQVATASPTSLLPSLVQRYHLTKYHSPVRTPWVAASGSYAIVGWDDENVAGTMLLRFDGRWHIIVDGGGFMNVNEIAHHGVPIADARALYAQQMANFQQRRL